jgi:hypothetical protein
MGPAVRLALWCSWVVAWVSVLVSLVLAVLALVSLLLALLVLAVLGLSWSAYFLIVGVYLISALYCSSLDGDGAPRWGMVLSDGGEGDRPEKVDSQTSTRRDPPFAARHRHPNGPWRGGGATTVKLIAERKTFFLVSSIFVSGKQEANRTISATTHNLPVEIECEASVSGDAETRIRNSRPASSCRHIIVFQQNKHSAYYAA